MNTEEEDPLNGDVNEDKEDPEKGGAQRDDEKLKDGCFVISARMCAIYALAAIFCWSRHHFNIQYFLKNYHWFDPKVPAEDQEFKAHIILVVYAVSLIPYIIAAAVACSVAEQCRKYVHELNKPSEEVNE
ncbi:hypothetical protein QR680_015578 [Steinernema hermaphroditum]|uniref:Uncharacterized protein n=1 Tax=Steinernema hermaphroditum TaxID=289476 RepID=A0AA39H8J9_9BILA|nr:hypothetical protein QR680_015578 [Steinernema hermaphroditum]